MSSSPAALPDIGSVADIGAAVAGLRVAVLGPVLIAGPISGALVEPAGSRGKALIVALASRPGAGVSVSGLIDDLWEDAPPRDAKAALQTLVSRLRQVAAPELISLTASGYAVHVSVRQTDLGLAAALLDDARRARGQNDAVETERLASAGLALWRGEPGAGLGATELAAELRTRADRIHDGLLCLRAFARSERGDHDGALADLDDTSSASAPAEELVTLRMRILAAAGRRNDALRAFGDLRARLRDELGTDPSPALVRLNAELLREEPAKRQPGISVGLRSAPNKLIGRAGDLEAVEALMGTTRLTTILGPGGLGKTRLAQELGARAVATTPAVIVVELASVQSGADVTLVLASTLGIREASAGRLTLNDPGANLDVRERILATLAERETLLIVDNCEHIADAAAAWIEDILSSTSTVKVLATSRAPLAIGAERVYLLGTLAGTGKDSSADSDAGPAVALFIDRARAARPGVSLPLETISRLCARLDGLPLAIELAAARVRSMPVEEIERRLGNRFALLTSGERTAPVRHRTLMAVIDWSWNLLGASEQRLLRRLSRFPDGFSAEAAHIVGADSDGQDVADDLDGLVNQSLISVSEDGQTGSMRYRMLETVREFGMMALADAGENERVQGAMFRWAEIFAIEAMQGLNGRDQIRAFAVITAEQDTLVFALRQAIEAGAEGTAVSLYATLGYYWSMRGAYTDVASFGASVVEATRSYVPDAAHLNAATMSYCFASSVSMFGMSRSGLLALGRLRAMERLGVPSDERIAMMSALLLSAVLDFTVFREKLEACTHSADPILSGLACVMSSQLYENEGQVERALVLSRRAYDVAVESANVWAEATAAQSLAELYSLSGQPQTALEWAELSRGGFNAIQAQGDIQQLSWMIGMNEVSIGRLEKAREIFEHFLAEDETRLGMQFDDLRLIGCAGLAEIALHEGRASEGHALYRQAAEAFGEGRGGQAPWHTIVVAAAVTAQVQDDVRDHLGVDKLAQALRTRLLADRRLRPGFVDLPVAGAGMAGLAMWLLWPHRPVAVSTTTDIGLRLLFLGARMGCRQDLPTMNVARLVAAVVAAHRTEAVDSARRAAELLTPLEAMKQAFELLADKAVRTPFTRVTE